MLDWNFRVIGRLLTFCVLIGLLALFALATDTVRPALFGGTLAFGVQVALYWTGCRFGISQDIDFTRPMHQISRWHNTWFRTLKTMVEMLLVGVLVYVAYARLQHDLAAVASFVAAGLFLTGAPLPLLVWAYTRKVLQPSISVMTKGRPPVAQPVPWARPAPAPAPTPAPVPVPVRKPVQIGATPTPPTGKPSQIAATPARTALPPPLPRGKQPVVTRPPPAPVPQQRDFDDSLL